MFTYSLLTKPGFRFSPDDPHSVSDDRLRGLVRFGPYKRVTKAPRMAFVFPEGYRDSANTLYLALRNGLGLFKGLPSVFKVPLEKTQVLPITGFQLKNRFDHHDSALRYRDAIEHWINREGEMPDIFVNLHPKSMAWDDDSEYSATKAVLLQEGLLSQNVTLELIQNSTQFEWSVANIALGLFVKLGGVPWAIDRADAQGNIVIGMGRSESYDPRTRERQRAIAFTTCIQSDGVYRFGIFGSPCTDHASFMKELESTLRITIKRASSEHTAITTLTLHFPKDFSYEERQLCQKVAADAARNLPRIEFVKVTQEDRFFAIDDETPDQVPRRGSCIQLSRSDFLLYTEGSEERQTWINRPPSAVRIRHYREADEATVATRDVIGQVFDLSLSNWRAFNAAGYPVSILYSQLISRILQKADFSKIDNEDLTNRMWFL
jgi:argonaute-like protein implicated in RNA metabolism and viral defense